jgi:metal-sulfur cluster biosynthetic enzyme
MSATPQQLLEALREIPDPCSIAMRAPMDIVRMGLVDDLRIEHGRVFVELLLTDPSCVHFRAIDRYVRDVLLKIEGVDSVEVHLSTSKLWTPDRVMTQPAPR